MRRKSIRAILLVVAFILPIVWAADASAPTKPSELARLEQVLSQAQQEKDQGQLKPERYQEFLVQFRASLTQAWSSSQRTPPDTAAYARIQARMGDSVQALALLGPAMKQDTKDADLRLTLGEVSCERKDYPAALAEANAVLASDPGNKRALALKYSSMGRVSGASASSPPSKSEEGGSIWNDSKIVEAGRRATGRRNAIHFMDQAMGRLKIDDPREALRFLALAEVSDPTSADVPMQQGLAYMGLKDPAKAIGRFGQAEAMWQAKGDGQAELARAMKASAAVELTANPQEPAPKREPTQDPRRTDWPLRGAAAGLLLAGAVSLLL
ncbi:MAG: tetratricopeptide repeat protein, partial [Elusimicrobiota bacterium]